MAGKLISLSRKQNVCVDTLVKKSTPQQCAHCDAKLLPEKKLPIVALKREGTGYAGGGMAEATRFGLSFQA
jgi:nitric oxide synthase-interacting protein